MTQPNSIESPGIGALLLVDRFASSILVCSQENNITFANMEDYYEQQYVFDGIFYKIIKKKEIIGWQPGLLPVLSEKNNGHIEMVGVATEATTDSHVWTTEATKLLLEEYRTRTNKFRNSKIYNVILWREIIDVFEAHGYSGITEKILDDKFRSLKRTFNRKKNNDTRKSTDKGSIKPWEFYDSMADILQDDSMVNLHKAFIMSSFFAPPSTSTSPAHPLPSTSFAHPPPSSSPANPLPSTSFAHPPPSSKHSPPLPHLHYLQPILFPQQPSPLHHHQHPLPILSHQPRQLHVSQIRQPREIFQMMIHLRKKRMRVKPSRRWQKLEEQRRESLELERKRVKALQGIEQAIKDSNIIEKQKLELLKLNVNINIEKNEIMKKALEKKLFKVRVGYVFTKMKIK
ncbi:uncharacterized protein LOC120350454 [Nilaparvata lugens]|uniref:uncharacterized protein LOC120350454 n=1 Tax=Nilaparvata lugens TaxID=108931 RepID=UPI00193E5D80|nr:uncharacterized protein LOC120350454 [Nilaparvata lugens]